MIKTEKFNMYDLEFFDYFGLTPIFFKMNYFQRWNDVLTQLFFRLFINSYLVER